MRAHTLSLVAALTGTFSLLPHPLALASQDQTKPQTTRPEAKPEDVATLDGILGALYASISGPVGQPRDFARMRSLFADGARMLPTQPRGEAFAVRALSVDDYVERAGENLVKMGFREVETARRVDQFAAIAQAWSTYASFRGDEKEPFQRGINSVQLSFDGKRWWVQNIMWLAESDKQPIPAMYLAPESDAKKAK
jgi:hypothetical protein